MEEDRPTVASVGKRIEWTGAGGDYYLAVVVDDLHEVVSEFWGTQREVLAWMAAHHPHLPSQYVPMALGATRRKRNVENVTASRRPLRA